MTDFEREIGLLLTDINRECERLEARVQQGEESLETLYRNRSTLQEALDIYREHYQLPRKGVMTDDRLRQDLTGKSIKQMIITLVLEQDPPIFRVVDLNHRLVRAGVFKDETAAGGSVYSTLGRDRRTFIKVGKGRYLVNPEVARSVHRTAKPAEGGTA